MANKPFSMTPDEVSKLPSLSRVLMLEWSRSPYNMATMARVCNLYPSRIREILMGIIPNPGIHTVKALLHGFDRNLAWLEAEMQKLDEAK